MKRSPLYAFARTLLPWLFRVLFPMRIRNRKNMPETGRVILCCNHASMSDPLRLAYSQRRQIFYMSKAELFKNRFVGSVIGALGAFSVSRGTGDKQAINTAKVLLEKEQVLGIFIEGTRSKDGNFLSPKSGAVMLAHSCNAPILPCCITARDGGVPKIFRKCMVSYGELIRPEELGIEAGSPSEYRAASRLVMDRIVALREKNLTYFSAGD